MPEIDVRDARFHYQLLGPPADAQPENADATPNQGRRTVVFLHGLVMDNLSSWYFTLANPVATVADVLLYDMRGHGKTTRTKSGYTLTGMTADLTGLLDELGLQQPVTFVGNSFGGMLALRFAMDHPERVESVVLVDSHVPHETWAEEMQATLSLQGEERDRMIAVNFKDWLGRNSQRKSNRLAKNAGELVYETSLVEDLATFSEFTDEELANVRCPVLGFYGEDSDIRDHGDRLARTIPNFELRVFPESTHSIIWEKTAELREQVLDWVRQPLRSPEAAPSNGSARTLEDGA